MGDGAIDAEGGRPRLQSELSYAGESPIRLLFGPAGVGKTRALRDYVRRHGGGVRYVAMSAVTPSELYARLDFLEEGVEEIVFNELDAAATAVVDDVVAYVLARCDGRRFVMAGRSEQRVRAYELLASGRATKLDPVIFAMTAAETEAIPRTDGVHYDAETIAQLLHDTEGPREIVVEHRCSALEAEYEAHVAGKLPALEPYLARYVNACRESSRRRRDLSAKRD
ncbi:MAG: hypothetical protein NVS2B3_01570 [Vulcanimicrobiaceae bacterium]